MALSNARAPSPGNCRAQLYAIRQLGLMLFLAAVGIASGPAFVSTAFSTEGVIAIALAVIIALAGSGSMLLLAWMMGQPVVLQYALQNSSDARIMAGYSTTFAIALIYKTVVVPFILVV